MKRKVTKRARIVLFLAAMFLLFSCVTGVTSQKPESIKFRDADGATGATLRIQKSVSVVEFDGEEVKWEPAYSLMGTEALTVYVPAGFVTVSIKYGYSTEKIEWNFKAGERYTIYLGMNKKPAIEQMR